jgi:RNA 2',3'-cyclic 3'-phosphodiesterase
MRVFLALPIPGELRRAAHEAFEALGIAHLGWRLVREDGLHLTVRFLGEIDTSRAAGLDAVWREAAAPTGAFPLRIRGAGVFPNPRRPRAAWIGIDDLSTAGALAGLVARVEAAARAEGFAPDQRPFAAHVTVARARDGARAIPSLDQLGTLGEFVAEHLVLYRSDLLPAGARYTELARFALDGGVSP